MKHQELKRMSENLDICLVIPVYNEAGCLEEVINSWVNDLYFMRLSYRIILVNDGSTDDSSQILNRMAKLSPYLEIFHRQNSGHGKSVLFGYQEALKLGANWIFQVDSDNQFHSNDLKLLWAKRDQNQFILGVRNNRQDPLSRILISRFLRCLLALLFGVRIKDANIPYRLISADLLSNILPLIPETTFAPNIWLSLLAFKSQATCEQVKVTHLPRLTGSPSLPSLRLIKACIASSAQLINLRLKSIAKPNFFKQIEISNGLATKLTSKTKNVIFKN